MLRKQFTLKNVLIFSSGFICGLLVLVLLGSAAYNAYLYTAKIRYKSAQYLKSILAMQAGNPIKALVYQQNVVDTYNSNAFAILLNDEDRFNFDNAMSSFVLREIIKSSMKSASTKGVRALEGLERGRLAFLLDSIGMKSYADEEWKRAMELIGYPTEKEDAFKETIHKMVNNEKSLHLNRDKATD